MEYALIEGNEGDERPDVPIDGITNPWENLNDDAFHEIIIRINDYSSLMAFYITNKALRERMDGMFHGLGAWMGILKHRFKVEIPKIAYKHRIAYFSAQMTARHILSHPNRTYRFESEERKGIVEIWKENEGQQDLIYEINVNGEEKLHKLSSVEPYIKYELDRHGEILEIANTYISIYRFGDDVTENDYYATITRETFVDILFKLWVLDGYHWRFPVAPSKCTDRVDQNGNEYIIDDDGQRINFGEEGYDQ